MKKLLLNLVLPLMLLSIPSVTTASVAIIEVTKTSQSERNLDFFKLSFTKNADGTISVLLHVGKPPHGKITWAQLRKLEGKTVEKIINLVKAFREDGSTIFECKIPIMEADQSEIDLMVDLGNVGTCYRIKLGTYLEEKKP